MATTKNVTIPSKGGTFKYTYDSYRSKKVNGVLENSKEDLGAEYIVEKEEGGLPSWISAVSISEGSKFYQRDLKLVVDSNTGGSRSTRINLYQKYPNTPYTKNKKLTLNLTQQAAPVPRMGGNLRIKLGGGTFYKTSLPITISGNWFSETFPLDVQNNSWQYPSISMEDPVLLNKNFEVILGIPKESYFETLSMTIYFYVYLDDGNAEESLDLVYQHSTAWNSAWNNTDSTSGRCQIESINYRPSANDLNLYQTLFNIGRSSNPYTLNFLIKAI